MSRLALGAVCAGGLTWVAARLVVRRLVDEEADPHDWTSAAGDVAWSRRQPAPARAPLVLALPASHSPRIYTAA